MVVLVERSQARAKLHRQAAMMCTSKECCDHYAGQLAGLKKIGRDADRGNWQDF
jgi:hypothetical protein